MARKRTTGSGDRGRHFYETSSPFETYEPGSGDPKTFKGQTDKSVDLTPNLLGQIAPKVVKGQVNPEQYDNPRGYGGMALIQFGGEKPKLPFDHQGHTIAHQTEESAKLARTGK